MRQPPAQSYLLTSDIRREAPSRLRRRWAGGLGSAALLAVAVATSPACRFKTADQPTGTGGSGATGLGGTGGPMISNLTALSISPPTATLTVTPGGPAQTLQYTVTGTVNGQDQDVTTKVAYTTTPSGVVTVSPGGLVTTLSAGGQVKVTATSGTLTATATLTVVYGFSGADPGMASSVPSDASTKFGGSDDATRAPQLVYPNDGVLFPPNVSGIEIHFTPGANNTLFEVSITGAYSTYTIYVRCTAPAGINGCIYLPDPALWGNIARSNAGQGPATLKVRGTDDTGTSVGSSATTKLQFAKDAVMGGLYYWTTSGSTAIMRWDFGGSTTTAQPYLTPTNTDGRTCVGCHALSLDGTKLVASAGGQNDGRLLLWNIANNRATQPFPLAQKSQFESWNRDGSKFVGVYGDTTKMAPVNLMIMDGTSGAVTDMIDLGGLRADHPDWAKAGAETIAFTTADPVAKTTDQRPGMGGIAIVQNDGNGWGAPQVLVQPVLGKNRYYPAISPDGTMLIFDESTCPSVPSAAGMVPDHNCNADTDATATVFMSQLPPADPTPVLLANANLPGVADNGTTALTNSFPKWAPFVTQLDEFHKLYWFTFSSTRQYGLRKPPTPANTSENPSGTLIWMVGVQAGVNGGDPSFTAFCLPFQDITTSNHIAQWTKVFIPGPG
jgi:hypothetical protein